MTRRRGVISGIRSLPLDGSKTAPLSGVVALKSAESLGFLRVKSL